MGDDEEGERANDAEPARRSHVDKDGSCAFVSRLFSKDVSLRIVGRRVYKELDLDLGTRLDLYIPST